MSLAETESGVTFAAAVTSGAPSLSASDRTADQPHADHAHDRCLAMLLADRWHHDAVLAELGGHQIPYLVATTARVARTLGERWVADTCSFADVTLGLHRLTLLLFAIEALPDPERERLHGGTVLLAPMPGDQHGFGLATVALALRRAGWDVTLETSGSVDTLLSVARRGFDCIGLSVGHDRAVPKVARLIGRLRAAARPRTPAIALGGPMLARDPSIAATVGADIAAVDGFALADRLRPLLAARAA